MGHTNWQKMTFPGVKRKVLVRTADRLDRARHSASTQVDAARVEILALGVDLHRLFDGSEELYPVLREFDALVRSAARELDRAKRLIDAQLEREQTWLQAILDQQAASEARRRHTVATAHLPWRGRRRASRRHRSRQAPVMPAVRAVEVDELTATFHEYGDASTDYTRWTGADSTYSVGLPDGRTVWIFSDTFVGPVHEGTREPVDHERSFMPANSLVVQDGSELSSILGWSDAGGAAGMVPAPVVHPRDAAGPRDLYWAGDAHLCHGEVEIMYRRYGLTYLGKCAVARFDPRDLSRPVDVVELPFTGPVAWGSAVNRVEGHTYVYGARDDGEAKQLYVARVEGDSMIGDWEFLGADGTWSEDPSSAAAQLSGVGNEFSVSPIGGGHLLVTHDTSQQLSADIVGYFAATPEGPFEQKTLLYKTPETGASGSYGNPRVYTHNAHAHPQVDRGENALLISYNVHAWELPGERGRSTRAELYGDTSVYRPRFVTVRFGE